MSNQLKGKDFENQVEKVLVAYKNKFGGHYHKNNPLRLHNGKYVRGEVFDFEVFSKGYKCVFDCKSIDSETWQIREKDFKQLDNLLECKQAGLDAYFLINFNGEVREVDAGLVVKALGENRKNIKYKEVEDKQWYLYQQLKKSK